MSFREKIAWASFITTVLVWGAYFTLVVIRSGGGFDDSMSLLLMFVAATVAQAVLLSAAAIFWAVRAPDEAHAPVDERDRAVARSATGAAYFVVVLALLSVIAWLHFGLHGRDTIFALIGVFILGEAVRFGAQGFGYRAGR